ncbi:MAG: glycosyltransferase family 87 protein, partial [Chloroflexota bacterium]
MNPRQERLAVAVLILTSVAVIGNMLWIGRSDSLDTAIYRCYAHAFWDGPRMLQAAATKACVSLWSAPPQQFHTFPHEYPPLALAVFSLPLLLPGISYTAGFVMWLGLIMLVTAGWLIRRRQLEAAAAFVLYTLLAGWAFTLQRFDLLAGVIVLLTLVLAQQGRPRAAAGMLALATLLKLFPVVLLPFLLIACRRGESGRWRWDLVTVFLAVCGAGILPELLLSPSSLWSPIHYELARPLQIESLPGSLLWSSSGMPADSGNTGPHVAFSYYSLNVVGGAQLLWGTLAALIGLVGMV